MLSLKAAHLCCALGGSLWTGAILGWDPIYALDIDPWRSERLREQRAAGWWPESLRIETCDIAQWEPPELDGELDILAAGFSCKDISIAGRRAGLDGSQTGPTYQGCLTAIDAWRPTWVIFENSPNIRSKGLDRVYADLVERGYAYRDGIIAASDVGAPHQRDRWYLVAHLACQRRHQQYSGIRLNRWPEIGARPEAATDTDGLRKSGQERQQTPQERGWFGNSTQASADVATIRAVQQYTGAWTWNPPHPDLCRMAHGLADREHCRPGRRGTKGKRIAALGDAWVPLQAATAWCMLGGPYVG